MGIILALLPIFSVFLLLFVLKQSSLRSGVFAYLLTLLITSMTAYFNLSFQGILHATVKGVLISSIAAYVLFFGIFLFNLMNQSGKISSIAAFISDSTNDKVMQVIILVVGFSPLIESTSGFGTAFLVITPILIALGFQPFKSVLIGLVSLLAVPWGALATGTVIGAKLGDISLDKLGTGSAIISIPIFIYFLIIAVYLAGGEMSLFKKWKEVLLFSFVFSLSILLSNLYMSVELAGVLSALMTTGLGLLLIKVEFKKKSSLASAEIPTSVETARQKREFGLLAIIKIMSPYLFLTSVIFISRLVPPISEMLRTTVIIRLPNYSFRLALLYEPGFWLFISCLFAIIVFKIPKKTVWTSLMATMKQWVPFVISTTAFVSMAEVMARSGMTMQMAAFAGTIFGSAFIIISPLIGGLGGFLTGSNTGSNAMFIKLQVQTAKQLGLPRDLLAYAQVTSSSHATMAAPARVLLGATLAGIKKQETNLLRSICFIVSGALLIIILMVTSWFFILNS